MRYGAPAAPRAVGSGTKFKRSIQLWWLVGNSTKKTNENVQKRRAVFYWKKCNVLCGFSEKWERVRELEVRFEMWVSNRTPDCTVVLFWPGISLFDVPLAPFLLFTRRCSKQGRTWKKGSVQKRGSFGQQRMSSGGPTYAEGRTGGGEKKCEFAKWGILK